MPNNFDSSQIDADAEYAVKVTKPLQFGAANILPLHTHTMTGAFLALIVREFGAEVIHDATRRQ